MNNPTTVPPGEPPSSGAVTLPSEGTAAPALPTTVAVPGYEIVRELGRGGMGVVYLARQGKLNRLVALKMILAGGHASEAELARFKTEAEAIARLAHPGIVAVHEVGEYDGKPFFSLEYCPGGSLDHKVAGTPIEPREAAALVRELAEAVRAAHDANVLHRDLKPANVLLAAGGSLKITDFGLAKKLDEQGQTRTGAIMGTPSYMAPEQASGSKEISPLADVYSLGAILYECLTGRPPFKAATTLDTVLQVLNDEPVGLRRLNPKVPADLETICHKCLAKEPARRYPGARELADDLGRYLDGRPVTARPVGRAERGARWCRRNPAVAALSAAVALLVLGAAVAGPMIAFQQAALRREANDQRHLAVERADQLDKERERAEANAAAARDALYAARQQVAMNAWRENRADRLAETLELQKPAAGEHDRRGFEWAYLDRLARSPGRRWRAGGEMVNGIAISPDGKTAVSVGFDGKATAWDTATGRAKWDTGAAFRWSVNGVAISPDGKSVALAGHLGQLQLWTIDGKQTVRLQGHRSQVFGTSFSPDGKTLASASADNTARLWDVASGRAVAVLGDVARDGPQFVDPNKKHDGAGHAGMVWQASWSPDGNRLATCSTDGTVKVWSVAERKVLRTMSGHEGVAIAACWSPDGRRIASVSRPLVGPGGEVKVWNPDTGQADTTFRPPSGGFHAVAFTPDGLYVVTAGADRTVRVWRKDGRAVAEHRGFRGQVIGLAVKDRWAVAGTAAGEVVAFDLDATPGKQSVPANSGTRLAIAPDGRLAVSYAGAVNWHDPESLAKVADWPAVFPVRMNVVLSDTSAFALRPDGQSAHAGHGYVGPGVVIWRDAAGQVRHRLEGHAQPVTSVAFLPDDRLASASKDGALRLWDGSGRSTTLQPWSGSVRFLVVTPGGRLWVGGEGGLARVEDGRVVWQAPKGSPTLAGDVSPDGRTLVVSHQSRELAWLDPDTGAAIHRSQVPGIAVSLRFSPDGRRIAAGFIDGTVRLLDAGSGEEVLVLDGTGIPATDLAFYPDGHRLVVATDAMGQRGKLTVWDGRPAGEFPPLPAPEIAWHKARLDAADDSAVVFGPRVVDRFAMRYHLERLIALEPKEAQWASRLRELDKGD